jgi:hypothetical protein
MRSSADKAPPGHHWNVNASGEDPETWLAAIGAGRRHEATS